MIKKQNLLTAKLDFSDQVKVQSNFTNSISVYSRSFDTPFDNLQIHQAENTTEESTAEKNTANEVTDNEVTANEVTDNEVTANNTLANDVIEEKQPTEKTGIVSL